MHSSANERAHVQARGIPYARGANSPTELARIVAARQRWKIGTFSGDIFDAGGDLVVDSVEELARACAALGVFAGDECSGYHGVNWRRVTPALSDEVRRFAESAPAPHRA